MSNNAFHRNTGKAWVYVCLAFLFVGIFVERSMFGSFIGFGGTIIIAAIVFSILQKIFNG